VSEKKDASEPEKKPEKTNRTAKRPSLNVIEGSNYFDVPPEALRCKRKLSLNYLYFA
jgi:hypothetical protein